MFSQILNSRFQRSNTVPQHSDSAIARTTEESTHFTYTRAMVDNQRSKFASSFSVIRHFANSAHIILFSQHAFVISKSHSEVSSFKVFSTLSNWIFTITFILTYMIGICFTPSLRFGIDSLFVFLIVFSLILLTRLDRFERHVVTITTILSQNNPCGARYGRV